MTTLQKMGIACTVFIVGIAGTFFALSGTAQALVPTSRDFATAGPFEYVDANRIKGEVGGENVVFTRSVANGIASYVSGEVVCDGNRARITPPHGGNGFGVQPLTEITLTMHTQDGGGACIERKRTIANIGNEADRNSIVSWLDASTLRVEINFGDYGSNPDIKKGELFTRTGDSGNFLRDKEKGGQCVDQIILNRAGTGAIVVEMQPGSGQAPATEVGPLFNFPGCEILSINNVEVDSVSEARDLANDFISVALDANKTKPAGSAAADAAEVGEPSCESENNGGLEWIICPILSSIDSAVSGINNIILEQLVFNPEEDLGAKGSNPSDQDGTADDNGVKVAWNIIKNIATFLIVIIMLVMVLSTTISWGPFDAYTVRSVLPRLIIAIVGMQLSWEILMFIIELTNIVGRSIADLMYAPFGGASNLTLSALLGANTGEAAATTIFATAAISAGVAAFIAPFGILVLAISVLASIFIGFIVLLVRNILIILCLILAPLAFLAWVLPGTRNYWNYWQETFGKLMLMFPFIMALLAAGRIFAKVTGVSTTGDAFGGLINFVAVLLGVFGPYWLLPKTLQWGGRAFGTLTGTLQNANTKGIFDRSKNFARQRGKELKAQRDASSGQKLATGNAGLMDKLKASQLDPTIRYGKNAQRVRQQKLAAFVAAGRSLQQQQLKDAENRLEQAVEGRDFPEQMFILSRVVADKGRTDYERRAAIKMLADNKGTSELGKLRDGGVIELKDDTGRVIDRVDAGQGLARSDNRDQVLWNTAMGENFGSLKALSPHLAKDSTGTRAWLNQAPADRAGAFTGENDELLSKMRKEGWQKFAELDVDKARDAFLRVSGNDNISSNLNPAAKENINDVLRSQGKPTIP